jgi:hypothetical protein
LASWEPAISDDELLDTEFRDKSGQPDLRPSVYAIDPVDVVQAFAEHSTMREPPSSTRGVDLGGTGRPVAETPGETGFALTMEAHREIELVSRDDLLGLVRDVRGSIDERSHMVTRDQARAYVRERLAMGDQEWERAQMDDAAKRWLRKLST